MRSKFKDEHPFGQSSVPMPAYARVCCLLVRDKSRDDQDAEGAGAELQISYLALY